MKLLINSKWLRRKIEQEPEDINVEAGSNQNQRMDEAIADILKRPSGKRAYDKRTWVVQVAKMVNAWRVEANLTQKELADALNIQQEAVIKLESYNNENMPNVSTLIDIAHVCGRKFVIGSEKAEETELLTM